MRTQQLKSPLFLALSLSHRTTAARPISLTIENIAKRDNKDCTTASKAPYFDLTFISLCTYNFTQSPDEPTSSVTSISYSISNEADGVSTTCEIPLSVTSSGSLFSSSPDLNSKSKTSLSAANLVEFLNTLHQSSSSSETKRMGKTARRSHRRDDPNGSDSGDSNAVDWQPCASYEDSDGVHQFTIATNGAFNLSTHTLSAN
ncbi:hypothetical protein F5Y16DRAFT_400434 [Xylariaceae sp. FL0255]|nr:hypothetical protein F5Y16DRAFT_400434 [Xylariaceae sp. FL0255]